MLVEKKEKFNGRFSFTVYMNDSIVCQRFFDIPSNLELDNNAFKSINLKRCMENADQTGVIDLIKMDLLGKTQQYLKMVAGDTTATKTVNGESKKVSVHRLKLTGFITDEEANNSYEDALIAFSDSITGTVPLSNGRLLTKEYMDLDSDFNEEANDDEEYTLKVELKFGDNLLYATIWDASVYPRLVRSNINLSNRSPFKDDSKELLKPHNFILHQLCKGRQDLISYILYKITLALSKKTNEQGVNTKRYVHPKEYVQAKKREEAYNQGWWEATFPKWRAYQSRWS